MKKLTVFFVAAAFVPGPVAVVSCTDDVKKETDESIEVKFSANITPSSTRVADDRWEATDHVGLFMKPVGGGLETSYGTAANVPMTISDGVLTPPSPIYYPDEGSVDFVAYYPYTASLATGFTIPVDLSEQEDGLPVEILHSNNAAGRAPSTLPVTLDFHYSLAKLRVSVTAEAGIGLTAEDFAGMSVNVEGMYTRARLSLVDGTVSAQQDLRPFTLHKTGAGATSAIFEALVLPASQVDGEVVFVFNVGGEEYPCPVDGPYSPATQYNLGFTLDRPDVPTSVSTHLIANIVSRTMVDREYKAYSEENILPLIPDTAFRAYCRSMMSEWDMDGNGKLSFHEAAAVDVIEAGGFTEITSLEGIGYFSALKELSCPQNRITSLDVSKNAALTYLDCRGNRLASLDISKNTLLSELYCDDNELSSLDISNNISLIRFSCRDNPGAGNIFPVKAWFTSDMIPDKVDFTTGKWGNVSIVYYTGDTPPEIVTDSVYYTSTDYSADGRVRLLQAASEGAGIDIVLMGDGYSDRLVVDGTYGRVMNNAMADFFTKEPYKSLRRMFNVWSVDVVSANEVFADDSSTALECTLDGASTLITGSNTACIKYLRTVVSDDRVDNATVIVMINSPTWHGTCYMYFPQTSNDFGEGLSISYLSLGSSEVQFQQLVNHEANGHGFPKLGDEYWYYNSATITYAGAAVLRREAEWGWHKNLDLTSVATQVKWARFLTDSRYASQGLGMFEGGLNCGRGVWRPSEYSIMRYNTGGFNAPSREAIYYRAHKLAYGAEWQYDYETFAAWDTEQYLQNRATQTFGASVSESMPHTPPVVIPLSWREAVGGN